MQTLVPFLQQPIAPDYFTGLNSWTFASLYTYLQDKGAARLSPNLVFLGFCITTLTIFLAWRLIRSCCRFFRGPELSYYSPLAIVIGREVWIPKIVALSIVALLLTVSVLGVGLSNNQVSNNMLYQVDSSLTYFSSVVDSMQPILTSIGVVPSQAQSLIAASSGLPPAVTVSVINIANSITNAANQGYSSLSSTIQSINTTISNIQSIRATTGSQVDDYYSLSIKASWGLLGAVMLSGLSVIFFMSIHCPAGIATSTFLALILSLMLFILDLVFASVMMAGSDICPNSEVILYQSVSQQYRPLVSYYVNASSPQQAIEDLLASSKLLNTTDIGYQISTNVQAGSAQLDSIISSLPTSYQDSFTTIKANLTGSVNNIINAIGSSFPAPSGLVVTLNWNIVHPLYASTKVTTCCTLMNQMTFLWAIHTTLAWLLLLTCWAAMVLLVRLDKLPLAGDCCSCTCLIPSQFEQEGQSEESLMSKPILVMPAGHYSSMDEFQESQTHTKELQMTVMRSRAEAAAKIKTYGSSGTGAIDYAYV